MLPNGNRIRYRYDERQLQVAQIIGADSPEEAIDANGIRRRWPGASPDRCPRAQDDVYL